MPVWKKKKDVIIFIKCSVCSWYLVDLELSNLAGWEANRFCCYAILLLENNEKSYNL